MPQREYLDSTEFDYAKTKSVLEFSGINNNVSQVFMASFIEKKHGE